MKVLKFGGTSVGTVNSLTNVKQIIEAAAGEQIIVVVSALGGLTDNLIATANLAASGEDFQSRLDAMKTRHHDIIDALIPQSRHGSVTQTIDSILSELEAEYRAISEAGEVSAEALARVVAVGERCSSNIVTTMIDGAERFDSLKLIKTSTWHGRNLLADEATQSLIHDAFDGWDGSVAIVPGFISTDIDTGKTTNLGRGGSDFTAAILAAALNARVLEIWTDVDGFLTADPRIIPDARVLDNMSYVEAMDLCNFGAKVVYPPTIYPVFHKNIPIYIRNTFNPDFSGTRIAEPTGRRDEADGIKGVTTLSDTSLIIIDDPTRIEAAGDALSQCGIELYLASTPEGAACYGIRDASVKVSVEALAEAGIAAHIEPSLATVAVVGSDMQRSDMTRRLHGLLASNGITAIAIARQPSKTCISMVIDRQHARTALALLHKSLLSD